jgi:hypothetical protein
MVELVQFLSMAKRKGQRMGGKFTGGHTTVIAAATVIADIADECSLVTKIALGFIKTGLPSIKGMKRLKIQMGEASLLLTVRDNIAQQELRVYATDVALTKRAIAIRANEEGFAVVG